MKNNLHLQICWQFLKSAFWAWNACSTSPRWLGHNPFSSLRSAACWLCPRLCTHVISSPVLSLAIGYRSQRACVSLELCQYSVAERSHLYCFDNWEFWQIEAETLSFYHYQHAISKASLIHMSISSSFVKTPGVCLMLKYIKENKCWIFPFP